ncbi:MAG: hypothetical protein KatS3mg025_0133 [Bacteroidia bacterium]|jgi:hypothetical protein|nr:MAG: hypothetical protein KatS3mg025_0133 [Bacteroidia bacterium]
MDEAWEAICARGNILSHDFSTGPYYLSAEQIKQATQDFSKTSQREVRILCKQDTREKRPKVFQENNLFILPVKNGEFAIIKGDGYVDVPPIIASPILYRPRLNFPLETVGVGDSEMQHLDFAYAASIIRDFMQDPSLVLTIRGRKYTPKMEFLAGEVRHKIVAEGVQTEVDAGYEGKAQVVLVEAKNIEATNVIIRQLFYPFRQWSYHTKKEVHTLFFQKKGDEYHLWLFHFQDPHDYHSIQLTRSAVYRLDK